MIIYNGTNKEIQNDLYYLINPYNFIIDGFKTKEEAKQKAILCIDDDIKYNCYDEGHSYYVLKGEAILKSNIKVSDKI